MSIGGDGAWTYRLNNVAANVQAIKGSQSVTDTFTVATVGSGTKNINSIGYKQDGSIQ